jgi:hypothetical protein
MQRNKLTLAQSTTKIGGHQGTATTTTEGEETTHPEGKTHGEEAATAKTMTTTVQMSVRQIFVFIVGNQTMNKKNDMPVLQIINLVLAQRARPIFPKMSMLQQLPLTPKRRSNSRIFWFFT